MKSGVCVLFCLKAWPSLSALLDILRKNVHLVKVLPSGSALLTLSKYQEHCDIKPLIPQNLNNMNDRSYSKNQLNLFLFSLQDRKWKWLPVSLLLPRSDIHQVYFLPVKEAMVSNTGEGKFIKDFIYAHLYLLPLLTLIPMVVLSSLMEEEQSYQENGKIVEQGVKMTGL